MFGLYSKAFDLINQDILIAKLKIFGIDGKDLQLFKSYLAFPTKR